MTYRDETEALAAYEASTRAARDEFEKHEHTPDHLMGGELKAMHLRLFREFKAKADDALAFLSMKEAA